MGAGAGVGTGLDIGDGIGTGLGAGDGVGTDGLTGGLAAATLNGLPKTVIQLLPLLKNDVGLRPPKFGAVLIGFVARLFLAGKPNQRGKPAAGRFEMLLRPPFMATVGLAAFVLDIGFMPPSPKDLETGCPVKPTELGVPALHPIELWPMHYEQVIAQEPEVVGVLNEVCPAPAD